MSESADSLVSLAKKSVLEGVLVADAKGIIRSVNDHVCRIFGYTKHQLLGHDIKMLMEPAYRVQHDHYMESFLKTGKGKVVGKTRIVSGVSSTGERLRLRLALSFIASDTDPLFCALLEHLYEHTFQLTADAEGKILTVSGDPMHTFGYAAEELIGRNVSALMSANMAQRHAAYMKCYTSPKKSKIIGKVRNLEARHVDGHLFPICLEVTQNSAKPLVFGARITEVEGTTEGVINVDKKGLITSVSDSCRLLFGYEEHEMIGKPIALLAGPTKLETGSKVVSAKHKDDSQFFVSVDVTKYETNGEVMYRGILRRVLSAKAARKRSAAATDEHIFTGDIMGWYEITRPLGSGYFGTVKMATHRLTGRNVAVKTLKKKQYEEAGMAYPPREIDLIRKLNHPQICRLYDTIYTPEAIFMITEVVPGGELFDYVAQKEYLSEKEARTILRQLVSATDYMHRSGIVHRDLKMENILMDENGGVKVIDLGLGNFFDGKKLLNTFCGSADYAAPELWRGEKYLGPGVDIWSLGVVTFVITTGFIPFNDSNHVMDINYHWPRGRTYSKTLQDFVGRIFEPVDKRINMEELIQHPWLTKNGKLPPIDRPALKLETADLNVTVLNRMEELGFSQDDVRKAVLEDAHNQLTTTYYLLKHQMLIDEEEAVSKRLKTTASESESQADSPALGHRPANSLAHPEHEAPAAGKGSAHCIIS